MAVTYHHLIPSHWIENDGIGHLLRSSVIFASCRASCVQAETLVQSNKNPSSECKFWQAGPSHNPPFPILSIMRWSLILSAFIAVQSALSFVCVALVIPLQSDELERRAGSRRNVDTLRMPSKKIRENSKGHPHAYLVNGLAGGKMTPGATVTQTKLNTKKKRLNHAIDKLPTHQAGMLLRLGDVRLQFLLASCALIVDHVLEIQMVRKHLNDHGLESVLTLNLLWNFLINFLFRLDSDLHNKVKKILNGPKNMALIPGSINSSVRFLSCC